MGADLPERGDEVTSNLPIHLIETNVSMAIYSSAIGGSAAWEMQYHTTSAVEIPHDFLDTLAQPIVQSIKESVLTREIPLWAASKEGLGAVLDTVIRQVHKSNPINKREVWLFARTEDILRRVKEIVTSDAFFGIKPKPPVVAETPMHNHYVPNQSFYGGPKPPPDRTAFKVVPDV